MQKVKYSFVLPAYKARFFREAIDSILGQTYTNFELIIVNDASPEDLDSIVRSYDDPRIQYYVNKENIGGKDLVAQWNHCLEYANGEYVILASDDDIYFPQYLEKMDNLVQKYPGVNVYRPRIKVINEEGVVLHESRRCKEIIDVAEYLFGYLHGLIDNGIPYYLFAKKTLMQIGGFVNFPLAWGADDATVALMARGGMCIEDDILFVFRMSGINISTINNPAVVKIKLQGDLLLHRFIKDYINSLIANNECDKKYVYSLIQSLDRMLRSRTAAYLNLMNFVDAIKIIPQLHEFPWVTVSFMFKRVLKKILQLLHVVK